MSSPVAVRDLAAELKRFADNLSQSANELRSALNEMGAAQTELNGEFEHTTKGFASATLTSLDDDDFQTLATIAAKVDELGSQGLLYYRDNLITASARSLQAVNETLDNTVDVAGYQDLVRTKEADLAAATSEAQAKKGVLDAAKGELSAWEGSSTEDDLVVLDEEIARKGGRRLSDEYRGYYEGIGLLTAVWRYVTDPTYRQVRWTLEKYGHGKDGSKDAFADMANFRAKRESYNTAIATAQGEYDAAAAVRNAAQTALDKLTRFGGDVRTDAQILDAVHDKITTDLKKSPAFMKATADHYAEDFPGNLAFIVAKLATLEKLEKGTQSKLAEIQQSHKAVVDQYEKLSRLQQSLRVRNLDLDDLRRKNDAYRAQYDHYADAARESWNRTRDYTYDDYARGAGQTDHTARLIERIFLYNMLASGNNRADRPPARNELSDNSRFTIDLMGVNREAADQAGLPSAAFDISERTAKQMASFGLDDYKPGDLSLSFDINSAPSSGYGRGVAFDIDEPPPPPPPPSSSGGFGGGGRIGGGGSSFGIGSGRRTGGGGSSFGIGGGSRKSGGGGSSFGIGGGGRKSGGGGKSFKL